ncbi:hypothetical protein JHL17_05640 [Azospirillum sp. YIM B02556]|uniref:DUF1674 domain-containing protein n=1 Tax=Azospirillum endophyticum TaxID=2800326 RepID=A0ABS1F0E8_9PROT|nr:hypothetical protein [Azospirillum endophyticum]MBK1836889.1 hypothetical protein [Azospirillum endophyticum]
MSPTPESKDGPTQGHPMEDRRSGQAQVPKPPSRAEVEEISRSQEYLTDEWTGDGGKPDGSRRKG